MIDEIVREFRDRGRRSARTSIRVRDVREAVAVAEALKASGDADWFRGQKTNYPKLQSTYARRSVDGREEAVEQHKRYRAWARGTVGLEELAADDDQLIAVAQHYGIATTFIDFTTEPRVAGFFAADGDPPKSDAESCIFCLNIDQARRMWQITAEVRPNDPVPELLEMDVPNLWRLEAQRGTFVWSPYDDLDRLYPLPRITFPYTGPPDIPREDIYPRFASPLEHLLDQYFQEEAIRYGTTVLNREVFPVVAAYTLETDDPGPFLEEMYLDPPPSPHASWTPDVLSAWTEIKREAWSATSDRRVIAMPIDASAGAPAAAAATSDLVARALADTPINRREPIAWRAAAPDVDPKIADALTQVLQRVWDGMTRLPYSDEEIGTAMGASLGFAIARNLSRSRDAAAALLLDSPIALELGGGGVNVHARAWVDEAAVRAAIRDDFKELLVHEKREKVFDSVFNLLMTARNPRVLFDFDRLRGLFAAEIVPTMVALDPNNPTIYSPARVDVIGPP